MFRRLCFDVSCSLYHDPLDGWIPTPAVARRYFADSECNLWGATVYDEQKQEYTDFTDCGELVLSLLQADELISFNGRCYDMIALEKMAGEAAVSPLWKKRHHDLRGWTANSLKDSIKVTLPELADCFDQIQKNRTEELGGSNTAKALGNTYRDTMMTNRLFEQYLASGSTEFTFSGPQ